ncbi:MAG: hypothetical protein M3357_01605 [Actinomycetota bacterium]|nr:hypothetical protein [Actinomycetota bacterium]
MGQEPEEERVVGVFRDEHAAEEAAEAARASGAEEVHVGASGDEVAALRAEMREEAAEVRPGFATPEMTWSVPLTTAVAALVGIVVALPLGFLDSGDVPLATRLLIVGFAGAITGVTIGFIFGVIVSGGFFGRRRRPKSELAAERGVVVGATESTGQVAPTLGAQDPIRVDKMAPSGQPKETVTPERRTDES